MKEFLIAFSWGLLIIVSFLGWGSLASWRRGWGRAVDWLEAPGWGMATCVVLGGILNLMGMANRGVILGCVAVGWGFACCPMMVVWYKRGSGIIGRKSCQLWRDIPTMLVCGAIVLLLALRFSGSVNVPSFESYKGSMAWRDMPFNPHDDMHSYLVSLERLR